MKIDENCSLCLLFFALFGPFWCVCFSTPVWLLSCLPFRFSSFIVSTLVLLFVFFCFFAFLNFHLSALTACVFLVFSDFAFYVSSPPTLPLNPLPDANKKKQPIPQEGNKGNNREPTFTTATTTTTTATNKLSFKAKLHTAETGANNYPINIAPMPHFLQSRGGKHGSRQRFYWCG